MRELSLRVALCLLGLLAPGVSASADTRAQALAETMDMLRHAIAVETVEGKGQMPTFATYLAGKLESAGFAKSDIEIIPLAETAALVVHYRGSRDRKSVV